MATNLIRGALSGLFSTIPMTGVMELGHDYLPARQKYVLPPRQITAKILSDLGLKDHLNTDEVNLATLLSHLGYGAAGGAIYGLVSKKIRPNALTGAAFGLAVWAGSYLGWLPAAKIRHSATEEPAERNAVMIAAHLVWGAALGKMIELSVNEKKD